MLVGAGLLIRSFDRLSRVDLGLNPEHVLTASFDLSDTRYNPDQQDRFVNELVRRLRALPGVTHGAGSVPLPLSVNDITVSFNWPDRPVPERNEPSAGVYVVTPGFFETLQIPRVRGRTFDERDHAIQRPS